MFLQIQADNPPLKPDVIFNIGNFPVSNSLLMIWVILILLIVVCLTIRRFKITPRNKYQHIIEIVYESMLTFIEQLTGSKKYAKKLFPLIAGLFVFIGISNLIGLIPGLTSITYEGVSLLRTPTNDFNTTFSIALAMVILTQIISIRDWGIFGHLGKYFKFKELYLGFKQGFGAGFQAIIEFLIGLLDIVSEIAKTISLSLRLFGNMYAGETLAIVILGALAYGLPSVWLAMNLLVAVVQALVFGSLTAAYYMISLKPAEENEN